MGCAQHWGMSGSGSLAGRSAALVGMDFGLAYPDSISRLILIGELPCWPDWEDDSHWEAIASPERMARLAENLARLEGSGVDPLPTGAPETGPAGSPPGTEIAFCGVWSAVLVRRQLRLRDAVRRRRLRHGSMGLAGDAAEAASPGPYGDRWGEAADVPGARHLGLQCSADAVGR